MRENGTTSEVEDVTARSLETLNAAVEVRSFVVQLVNASAKPAQICNDIGIVLQHVTDRIEVSTRASIQAGVAH